MLEFLEEFLLHAHVVVGDCEHGDSIGAGGLVSPASIPRDRCAAPKQFFLQEDESRLRVLQGPLMSPDLRKHRTRVKVGICRVLHPRALFGATRHRKNNSGEETAVGTYTVEVAPIECCS